jgi:hypothetical protein
MSFCLTRSELISSDFDFSSEIEVNKRDSKIVISSFTPYTSAIISLWTQV